MSVGSVELLKKLRAETNHAIDDLRPIRAQIPGAINWADLRCVKAEFYTCDCATTGYRVWIEEASPDSAEFSGLILEALIARGWENIEVSTEW